MKYWKESLKSLINMFNQLLKLLQSYKLKKIINQKQKNQEKIKLNLGCGTDYKEGWINIDNNSDKNIKKLDVLWDLRNPLPIPEKTVDFIFHEHLLEHLTVGEGINFLKECLRILKPKGVMRIAIPDLEETVKDYYNPHWKKASWIKKYGCQFIKTKAEKINISFRFWGHQWLYDEEELRRRLKESGFTKIKRCQLRKSRYKELQNLETRDESTLIVEVIK